MALLLLSRTCNAPILRISVLKQVSRKEIFRTFARRHTLKKQARTPPTNKLAGIYKMASLLFSRACDASALQIKILKQIPSVRKQILRTCVDEKSTDALRTRISHKRILKKQVMAPPTDKSAEIYKKTSLFSKAYNGLILRVKVLNHILRIQIFRTFADKLDALRSSVSRKLIRKKHVMAPPTDKSAEIYKKTSLFSKAYNGLTLRVKVLNQILRIQIFRTFADKLDALRSSVSRKLIRKKQVMAPPTDKSTNFYRISLSTRAYNGLIHRIQIFRTFADKLDALRTRISRSRILKEQALAPPTDKSAHIYKRTSLFSKAYNDLILRVKVLNQIPRIQIYRTFSDKLNALRTRISRSRILKKQALAPPTDKSGDIYKRISLFSKAYNDLILRVKVLNQIPRVQIYKTCTDKLDALRSRVSRSRILKEQALAPPTDKSADIYKRTSLFSKAYNDLILRVKVLNQIPRIQIYRTFADKLNALRTRISRSRILKEQALAPPTDKSADIYKRISLFSKAYNDLILRVKVLNQIPRVHIYRTCTDKLDALRTRVLRSRILKEQALAPPTAADIYKRTSLFNKAYNDLILRVKVLNQIPRVQIYKTCTVKLDALRTRVSRRLILKAQVMAPAKTKVSEINNMVSLLFNKVSTVSMLRFKVLQQISLKQMFRTFADELNALRTRVSRIRSLKEQTVTSATDELVEINKMASLLFTRIGNDLTLRLKVLKQVLRKQIFGTFTYESPISALRTSRYHRRISTDKRPNNIDKGALTIGSVGIGTLFFYKLGLLNQPDNIEIYVYFGCSIAVAVASAMAAFYSPAIMNILTRKGFMTQIINMAAIISAGVVAQNIEYNPGFGFKQLAWLVYASVVGIMFAPMLIGPFSRRAMHTTGVCVGLYVIAACAPKETLYDPINEALSIFMDILNIFIRIAAMFAKLTNKNK